MLEKLFKLKERNTKVRTEVIAGITTFLTMAYIIFVNPMVLSDAGMDEKAVFVATCVAAAVGCFIMGFIANYPIALAPGMGLNAFFTYTVVGSMHYSWQVALGCVFLSGVCFILLSLFKVREWVINTIPMSLRQGIGAGIGLFLGFIALKNAHIIVGQSETLVTLGDVTQPSILLAALGFVLVIALERFRIRGGVMLSILIVTAIAVITGMKPYTGIVSAPPSMAPTFNQLDIAGAFNLSMISIIFSFLFVDLFDTAGTLMAVAQRGNMLDKSGNLPRLNRALLADSTATVTGSIFGTSSTTSYIESAAGVEEGGRTGLTAVITGIMFLLALFFSPLAKMIPDYATTGALFYVAVLMLSGLTHIDWSDLTEAAPAVIVAIMMPLTYSIATGIEMGFITYAAIKLASGRWRDLSISVICLALIFVAKIFYLS